MTDHPSPSDPPVPPTPPSEGYNYALLLPLWIIAGLATVAAMYWARVVLIPLALAFLLACLMQPVIRWMRRAWGLSAAPAALICMTLVLALTALGGIWSYVGIMSFITQSKDLPRQIEDQVDKHQWLRQFFPNDPNFRISRELPDIINRSLADSAPKMVSLGLEVIAQAVLVLFMAFFFLAEGEWLLQKAALLIGQHREGQRKAMDTFERIGRSIVHFMVARTLINAAVGVLLTLSLYALDIPNAVTWGILAAILTYIPYVGPLIAAVPPLLLGMLKPENPVETSVLILVIFAVLFTLEGYVAVPMFMGKALDLNATTVMVACLFWWVVWGDVGLVLAIPFTAAIRLSLAEVHDLRYFADMMGAG